MKRKNHTELFEMIQKDKLKYENDWRTLLKEIEEVEKLQESLENEYTRGYLLGKKEELKNKMIGLRNYYNLVKKDYVQKQKVDAAQKDLVQNLQEQKGIIKNDRLPF